MNKILKAKWIKALLSGRYEQGKGSLVRDGRYCCLGVLCKVAGYKFKKKGGYKYGLNMMTSDLPPQVAHDSLLLGERCLHLAKLNDDGEDFKAIAKVIQETC